MLVIIGPRWGDVRKASGQRSLDDPTDPVRLEIAAALRSGKRVIPVLVGGASFPAFDSFPPEIHPLARRNAIELDDARWATDAGRLVDFLENIVPDIRRPHRDTTATDARDIFISYIEEDSGVAMALAQTLRTQGASTWMYEEDGVPGVSYLTQVNEAIEGCRAVVLIASERSVKAHQIIREVEAAHELAKMIIPVRIGLTHEAFTSSSRILRMATGTAVSLAMRDDVANVARRIAQALRAGSTLT